jgi:AcrR family transcriptional regulator
VDNRLLDAAVAVLEEHGFAGLTLERVADQAGRSRVTLWRQQVTQEALVDGLLARLTRDYRDAMWPAMAESGTGAQRLDTAVTALLDVADTHLHLLGVSDDIFERAAARMRDITGQSFSFLDPFVAALRAGATDGSLGTADTTVEDAAAAVFASACWGYVQLRRRLGWPPQRARPPIVALAVGGLSVSSPPARASDARTQRARRPRSRG